MKSEEFLCPNCKAVLKKSSAAVGLGELPSTVKCPNCGGLIATRSMMKGFFDVKKPQAGRRTLRWVLYVLGILLVAATAGRMAVLFLGFLRLAVFAGVFVLLALFLLRLLKRKPGSRT